MKKLRQTICFIISIALLVIGGAGCKKNTEPSQTTVEIGENSPVKEEPTTPTETLPPVTAPQENPYVEPPTEPPVQVQMPDYELSYAGEMADIISWEELEGEQGLQFYVTLSTGKIPLFALLLNKTEGEMVILKENGAGEKIPVTFRMEPVPQDLSQEDTLQFCMAQDLANQINDSLKLK